jgi:hypothetical protein
MSEQYVVVYSAGGKTHAHTTVYDDHEATRQRARCRQQHGIHCGDRVVTAAEAMRLCAKGR